MRASVEPFFDPDTFTFSYVVSDMATGRCAIIDSVLDYDPTTGKISTRHADLIAAHIEEHKLSVDYHLETHVHADHLSASHYLKQRLGGKTGIGQRVTEVQSIFADVFNVEAGFCTHGSQFDLLLAGGDSIPLGEVSIDVMSTPGHTPACVTYLIENMAFVGDTLFMPDYGTARTDFPGGDAEVLFESIGKLLDLPDTTRLFMCHDYLTKDRSDYRHLTTVAEEKASNVHLKDVDKNTFIKIRQCRDRELAAPRLLLPSIQVNMRAGELPPAENNGVSYLKIPLKEMAA